MNWWFYENGVNFLEIMPETGFDLEGPFAVPHQFYINFILNSLKRIPQADADLENALLSLSPAKQAQMVALLAAHPRYQTPWDSPKGVSDQVQAKQNTVGIRTVGRRGGSRIGG